MKTIERIIDFIKSYFYYPKMKKYFDDRSMSNYNLWNNEKFARIKYALWHCKSSKKIEKSKQNNDISMWTCQYKQEPIIRK